MGQTAPPLASARLGSVARWVAATVSAVSSWGGDAARGERHLALLGCRGAGTRSSGPSAASSRAVLAVARAARSAAPGGLPCVRPARARPARRSAVRCSPRRLERTGESADGRADLRENANTTPPSRGDWAPAGGHRPRGARRPARSGSPRRSGGTPGGAAGNEKIARPSPSQTRRGSTGRSRASTNGSTHVRCGTPTAIQPPVRTAVGRPGKVLCADRARGGWNPEQTGVATHWQPPSSTR